MNLLALTRDCRLVFALLVVVAAPLTAVADQKRVAIVYSETSKQAYWDDFAYYQAYMAAQYQCAMAGVPYDLLDENDLANAATLAPYDVLVAPLFSSVPAAIRPQILTNLSQASANGLSVITSEWFLTFDENGQVYPDFVTVMNDRIGVNSVSFYSGVVGDLTAGDVSHPAMAGYQAGEVIRHYGQIWTSSWQAAGSADLTASKVLANNTIGSSVTPAVNAIVTQSGNRNIHFANGQYFQDAQLLWSSIQWALYGSDTPVALRLGRERSIFFARNDMDQTMFAEEVPLVHVPLLDIITDWKTQHDFVGSYYINVGNKPNRGEFTDWNVTGPLMHQYRALGSEIGSHSYTHPHDTNLLTATELEFEFNQSVLAIEENLGISVSGAAVPGMPENPTVAENVAPYLGYLSGRSAIADSNYKYSSAFGHFRPDMDLFYFCMNTSPDFTLIGFLGYSLTEAGQIWQEEYNNQHEHAPLPVVHWLWHDYGPTGFEPGFGPEPFNVMVSTAAAGGSEFVTGADLHQRVNALRAAQLDVTQVSPDVITAQVTSADAGKFSLSMPEGTFISSVDNWYAWNENKVYLPKNGGLFTVRTNASGLPATRITKMPQRAELLAVTGNGVTLDFSFVGEGQVAVQLNESTGALQVQGADSFERSGSVVKLNFLSQGTHSAKVFLTTGNNPPEANSMFVNTQAGQAVAFILDATDPEGNPLQYAVASPTSGTLSGTPPNLTYTPNAGFSGVDQFEFSVSDGLASSAPALVFINVEATAVAVDGNLADWAGVAPLVNDPADTPDTVDILALYARVADGSVYLALENEAAIPQLNYGFSWYLDTDQSPQTGFAMFSIGADYLLEGGMLYKFAGTTQGAWAWSAVGPVTHAVQGNTAEFRIEPAMLGGSSAFDLIFWGPSSAFGQTAIDLVPNAGFARFDGGVPSGPQPIAIDGDFTDWPANHYLLNDGDDLAGVNPVDIMQVQMVNENGNLYLGYINETPLPELGWTYTLYLDLDGNEATGYQSGLLGGDFMIQDAGLYQYAGTGPDWTWTLVKSLRLAMNGTQVEIEVPLVDLGTPGSFLFECIGENLALGSNAGTDTASGQFSVAGLSLDQFEPEGAQPFVTEARKAVHLRSDLSIRSLDARDQVERSQRGQK